MSRIINYIPALLTAIVWGSTFVASKHVLDAGITPISLMTIRFGLAYMLLLLFSRQRLVFERNMLEFKLLLIGVCGGSLYFLLEYMALKRTTAVNVGLVCATVPVISTAIDNILKHVFPKTSFLIGSTIAFFGVYILLTDGKMIIDFFPIGDTLAICCAVLWAIYTVVLSRVGKGIKEVVVERRMMFYSLVTILPVALYAFDKSEFDKALLLPDVLVSILYLGIVASAGCMWLWNLSINKIGVIRTNNFLYLLPVVSLLTSAIFLNSEVKMSTTIATALILTGIVISDL